MQRLKPVDVAIAGGGWGGLAMAREITSRTSLSVLVVERGPARSLKDYAAGMDEVDYTLRYRLMQSLADETVTHRHSIEARGQRSNDRLAVDRMSGTADELPRGDWPKPGRRRWRRKPVSLADMLGHPVAGQEEEKD